MTLQLTVGLVVGGGLILMSAAVLALRGRLVSQAVAPLTVEEPAIVVEDKVAVLPGQLLAKPASSASLSAN